MMEPRIHQGLEQKVAKVGKKKIKISIGQSHHSYLEFYMRSHQN